MGVLYAKVSNNWVPILGGGGGGVTCADCIGTFVQVTGDEMTGSLRITSSAERAIEVNRSIGSIAFLDGAATPARQALIIADATSFSITADTPRNLLLAAAGAFLAGLRGGGPSGEAITSALGRHLPFHDRRLDLVMLTHPQLDHIGGLPTVIDEYDVGRVMASPEQVDSAAYRAWSDALRFNNVPFLAAEHGQAIDLGNEAALAVVSTNQVGDSTSLNDSSLVVRLFA